MSEDPHSAPVDEELALLGRLAATTSRRRFVQWAGITVGVAAVSACGGDGPLAFAPGERVDLGSGDKGVLNHFYALEQLEAAFYFRVISTPYAGISADELSILTDIRNHEIAHREFLRTILSSAALATLELDFSGVDFTSRASVLGTAKVLEDLGIAAYNGAAYLLTDATRLSVVGKIVAVEARHASAIRDLLAPSTTDFAGDDVVSVSSGLDGAMTPAAALAAASAFVTTEIDFSSLPTEPVPPGSALPPGIRDALNVALTLEYLEAEFYAQGVAAPGLIPVGDLTAFTQIGQHQDAHVALLQGRLGAAAVAPPTFDFTAGGTFADVFTNYATFLALAQGFEDTGVRAYRGQAGALISDNAILTEFLQLQAVEARHASKVRRMRAQKGWITLAATDVPALAAIYTGEDVNLQAGVNVASFVSVAAASEAFNEPLDTQAISDIVEPFIL
jgi:rubrerythrin